MLKHFIYLSSSKSTTSPLCSLYYRYSSKLSSFFCILSFLVIAISIDQTFYSATHYLAAVWLNSRHDFNMFIESKDEAKLTELNDFMILLNEDDFSLSRVMTEEVNLFSIWVEIKLFCFIAIFLMTERRIKLALIWVFKSENWRWLFLISIVISILFIHVFSRIIWCWLNWVISIEMKCFIWSWTVRFE